MGTQLDVNVLAARELPIMVMDVIALAVRTERIIPLDVNVLIACTLDLFLPLRMNVMLAMLIVLPTATP
jgi:hypothetical protein